jgi:hypothetical protein
MKSYQTGTIAVADYTIPVVSDKLGLGDFIGAVMVRFGINRGNYKVDPGLYSTGSPDITSDVFVTGNYKLSFDHLRKNLKGLNSWILVLDTKGVNVWCAAGKKTFGTSELVRSINEADLRSIVSHRKLILPQLGATGVAAHKVKEASGFNVHYGPVRAADIKEYIGDGYRASREMRMVKFGFYDRLKLIPNDFIQGKIYLLISIAVAFIIAGINLKGGRFDFELKSSIHGMVNVLLGYSAGVILTPALLPYLPFRMFSLKGLFAGLVVSTGLFFTQLTGLNLINKIGWFLVILSISSFMAMNFTGSSTYTSLSGVKREMKISIPLQIALASIGIILLIISWF